MIWGVWGSEKYAAKLYESIWLSFELFGHGKSPKTHQNRFSSFFAFLTRHRFFFVPRKRKSFFVGKYKRRAPENHRAPSGQKPLNFNGVPFCDESDVSFSCNPGIIHGQFMEIHRLSMKNPWIIYRLCGGS